jgi:outer membrane protein OmpA-like peptidoglycan-associated protein
MSVAPLAKAQEGYANTKFGDNLYVGINGGVGMLMSPYDSQANFGKRLGVKGGIEIGKWFTPYLGVRIGGEFDQMKGAADPKTCNVGLTTEKADKGTARRQKFNRVAVTGDVLVNLSNAIAGYKPGRVYEPIVYAGASMGWHMMRKAGGTGDWGYYGPNRSLSLRAGLINKFNITKRFAAALDLRFEEVQKSFDGYGLRSWNEYVSAQIALTYTFGNVGWELIQNNVVECPPAPRFTDAEYEQLAAQLAAANRKVADLDNKLRDCNKPAPGPKPGPGPVADGNAPLATIYYPINVSKIVGVQNNVVDAVANVMLNENNSYTLTGWADNYTGNDKINTKLRKDRVAGVKNALVGKGVAADRLDTQINDGNLTNFGPKCASLDRAVTIVRK